MEDDKTAVPKEILHLWPAAETSAGSELSPNRALQQSDAKNSTKR